jgi:hypothetical protein
MLFREIKYICHDTFAMQIVGKIYRKVGKYRIFEVKAGTKHSNY